MAVWWDWCACTAALALRAGHGFGLGDVGDVGDVVYMRVQVVCTMQGLLYDVTQASADARMPPLPVAPSTHHAVAGVTHGTKVLLATQQCSVHHNLST